MDIFSCEGVNVFEPYAIGAYAFLDEVYFCSGSSSVRRAYTAAEKLASDIKANCLLGNGYLSASSQHRSRSLLMVLNCCIRSCVTNNLSSFLSIWKKSANFSDSLGKEFLQ